MVRTLLCALLLTLLALPALAAGHAGARAAEADFSAVPGTLRVALDAPVERDGLAGRVDLAGITSETGVRRDPDDPAALLIGLSDLRPPTQEVSWVALSTDGHISAGTAVVRAPTGLGQAGAVVLIDAGDGPDGLLLAIGRGLALTGLLIGLGLVALNALVLVPAWREGGCARPPAL